MLAIMIADLPERYRDIMIEYVYLGRSDEQIARFMETAEGTEGFAAQNFYVSGTKEAILKLQDSLDTAGVRIVDARLYRG